MYKTSLDKIKFTARIKRSTLLQFYVDDVPCFLSFLSSSRYELIQEYTSFKACTYRYNYVIRKISSLEGYLYLGVYYNGDFTSTRYQPDRMIIEFNPNKLGIDVYNFICSKIQFEILDLKKFDIAFDVIGYTTADIKIFTASDKMTYGNNTSTTYYISPKQRKSGRIKIYDKHIERSRFNEIIPDTLRIECTFNTSGLDYNSIVLTDELREELGRCVKNINSIYIRDKPILNDYVAFMLDRMNDIDCNRALALMSYNTAKKYKDIIKNNYKTLELDITSLLSIIIELTNTYLGRIKIK